MLKRPFFSFLKPRIKIPSLKIQEEIIEDIPLPARATLFVKDTDIKPGDLIIKVGDVVKTGQKIPLTEQEGDYLISTVTGAVSEISEYIAYLGQTFTTVSIDTSDDQYDEHFNEKKESPSREDVLDFFNQLPGAPDFTSLLSFDPPINRIIVTGLDKDLLIATNQIVFKTQRENIIKGLEILKKIASVGDIIIVVPPELQPFAEGSGLNVLAINPQYPQNLPKMIMRNVLGQTLLSGQTCAETGTGFISAEAVSCLATAYFEGQIPVHKTITVINKDCSTTIVRARIGTSVGDILDALDIETADRDKIILGGPMTGCTVYSLDVPVSYDTDAIMVQDKQRAVPTSNAYCLNCGECVRACPARAPVNMLVRLLENGLYQEAAEQYDLLSCVECGLCSYVCMARIPIFHYIMLGKHELSQLQTMGESNA
jgi:electron transport complex protein RnfC